MIGMRAAIWMLCIVGFVFVGLAVVGLMADFLDITIIGLLLVVGLIVLWSGALFDIWRRADLGTASRLVWTLLIVFLPFLGTIIYVIARPPDSGVTYRGEQVV
jgi:hypothetical protein